MDTEKAEFLLNRQIDAIAQLGGLDSSSPDFVKWKRDTQTVIRQVFPKSEQHLQDFEAIHFSCTIAYTGMPDSAWIEACQAGLMQARAILESMIQEVSSFKSTDREAASHDSISILVNAFERFHLVSRQLRERHAGRPTLEIDDEYDAQDLLRLA